MNRLKLNIFILLVFVSTVFSIPEEFKISNVIHEALAEISEDLKNSETSCAKHLLQMISIKKIKDGWPLRMLDASSKLPSGLLSGNLVDLGSFDQCLAIETEVNSEVIKGQYCQSNINLLAFAGLIPQKPGNVDPVSRATVSLMAGVPTLTLAVCVPSSCSVEELQSFLQSSKLGQKLHIYMTNCQTNEVESFNAGDIAVLVFFVIILVVIVLSTGYDVYIQNIGQEPAHLILIAFSWYTHGKKLLKVSNNPNQLPCLHGIRFISMMWVIIGHTYLTAMYTPNINTVDILTWMKSYSSMYILGATVSVDTFFLIGGLLMSYVYLSAKDKGNKFNIFAYYIHRYIRLTPALAVAIIFHITLIRFLGTGPYWNVAIKMLETSCTNYWWSSLLYIQNYVNTSEMCMGQTWYLSVDMQLFILSPIVLIPLGIWPKIMQWILSLLILVSMIVPFTIAYIYEFPGLMSQSVLNPDFSNFYYMSTYSRFGPTVVGILLGYYVYNRREYLKFNRLFKNLYFNLAGWLIALVSLYLIVFTPNNMYYHDYNQAESSIYLGVHRVAWSIAVGWIIYACTIGHGGVINSFLSIRLFQIISRLTYSMYLIHLSFQIMKIGILRAPQHYGNFENMYNYWGDFIITSFLGIIWTLSFESPMITIEKIIFNGGVKKADSNKPLTKVTTEF